MLTHFGFDRFLCSIGTRSNFIIAGVSARASQTCMLILMLLFPLLLQRDTTANALSWTFYNLCKHPHVEAKLISEVRCHAVGSRACNLRK